MLALWLGGRLGIVDNALLSCQLLLLLYYCSLLLRCCGAT